MQASQPHAYVTYLQGGFHWPRNHIYVPRQDKGKRVGPGNFLHLYFLLGGKSFPESLPTSSAYVLFGKGMSRAHHLLQKRLGKWVSGKGIKIFEIS